MSALHTALDEYLAMRRALGHELRLAGHLLQQFLAFADQAGATYVTTDLALAWATQPAKVQPAEWARRLGIARQFAEYCAAQDPRTTVPPSGLLPNRYQRPAPYIYRDDEIARLLEAARQLPSATGLRSHTYSTLFGLYAVTGMRCSEPLKLDRDDVDLANGILTVRGTKFGKSRYVPLHASARSALQDYAKCRDGLCRNPEGPGFFVSEAGTRLTHWSVRWTFVKLSHQIGLRGAGDRRGPRLHDLRHRLAVNTLVRWYRDGVDVERHLPELSTYLGHAHITDTYWYLTATPELLQYALLRVEASERGEPV